MPGGNNVAHSQILHLGNVISSPQVLSSQVSSCTGTLLVSDVMLEGSSRAVQPTKKGKRFPTGDAGPTASPTEDSVISCWAPLSPSPADSTQLSLLHLYVSGLWIWSPFIYIRHVSGCLSSGRRLVGIILGAAEHTCQLQACIGTSMQSIGARLPISSHRTYPPGNDSRLNPGIQIASSHILRHCGRRPLRWVHDVIGKSIQACGQGVPGSVIRTGICSSGLTSELLTC